MTHSFRFMLAALSTMAIACGGDTADPSSAPAASSSTPVVASDGPSPGSCTFSGAWGAAATIQHFEFDPLVVNPRIADPVALKVKVPAGVDGASLALAGGGTLALAPQGAGLFCVMLTSAQVLSGYQAGDQHNFVGFLDLLAGTTSRARLNMYVNVADQIPMVGVERLRDDAQATAHVVNFHVPEQLGQSLSVPGVAQRFYDFYGDSFDFLNVVSAPAYTGNRFHVIVRNDVTGTGATIQNNAASYGSAGRLLGYNRFPIASFFDLASPTAIHEIGHQWISHSRVSALRSGSPHWPMSTLAHGIMGFSIGGAGGQGGTFPFVLTSVGGASYRADAAPAADAYNEMELYLMGLLPAEAVPPQAVLDNQSTQPCDGCVVSAQSVTVQDLIAADGPRSPAFPSAPSRFSVATIVVSMERLLTPREMSFFDSMSVRGEATTQLAYSSGGARGVAKPFAVATGNRGTLVTSLGARR